MAQTSLDILERLIAFPTVSRDGNRGLIAYVAELLREAGADVRLFPAPEGDRAALFARIGPDVPGGTLLSGHTDVVPVDGQAWTTDPFRLTRAKGLLYGRGTADMKGFVAVAIATMLKAARRDLSRPLLLALSYDEEIGCIGVRPMLAELAEVAARPAFVLVGEPTGMRVALGHKGKMALKATCCGHAAHSALAPTGLNAIHLAADLLTEIRALQDAFCRDGARDEAYDIPYTTLHAGVIRGGTALNIVPDRCELEFEIRNPAAEDPGPILDRLFRRAETLTKRAVARHSGTGIRIDVVNAYPGLDTNAHDLPEGCPRPRAGTAMKVAFGTEGGLFRESLARPVVVCGPGHMEQGHKPDEYVGEEQLLACETLLEGLVAGLA